MSESEELQAAMQASLNDDDSDEEVEYVGSSEDVQEEEEEKEPSFVETLLAMDVGEEPANGARIQMRMPDAKRLVRKFAPDDTVKSIYAFVAVRVSCGLCCVECIRELPSLTLLLHLRTTIQYTAIQQRSQGRQGVYSERRLSSQGFARVYRQYCGKLWTCRGSHYGQVEVICI